MNRNLIDIFHCHFWKLFLFVVCSQASAQSTITIGRPQEATTPRPLSELLSSIEIETIDISPIGSAQERTEEIGQRAAGKFSYYDEGNNGMRNSEGRLKRRVAVDDRGRVLVHYSPGNSIFLLSNNNDLSELFSIDFGEDSFPDNLYELDPRMLPKYLLQHDEGSGYVENFACFGHVLYFTFLHNGDTFQAFYNMNTGHSLVGRFTDDLFGIINLGNVPGRNFSGVLNSQGSPVIQLPPFALDFSKAKNKGLISEEQYQRYAGGKPASSPSYASCLILHFKEF